MPEEKKTFHDFWMIIIIKSSHEPPRWWNGRRGCRLHPNLLLTVNTNEQRAVLRRSSSGGVFNTQGSITHSFKTNAVPAFGTSNKELAVTVASVYPSFLQIACYAKPSIFHRHLAYPSRHWGERRDTPCTRPAHAASLSQRRRRDRNCLRWQLHLQPPICLHDMSFGCGGGWSSWREPTGAWRTN